MFRERSTLPLPFSWPGQGFRCDLHLTPRLYCSRPLEVKAAAPMSEYSSAGRMHLGVGDGIELGNGDPARGTSEILWSTSNCSSRSNKNFSFLWSEKRDNHAYVLICVLEHQKALPFPPCVHIEDREANVYLECNLHKTDIECCAQQEPSEVRSLGLLGDGIYLCQENDKMTIDQCSVRLIMG